jgi:putative membrane protein
MYDHDYFPFSGMPYGLGWVFMIPFWVLVIVGIIAIVRWLTGASRRERDMPSPVHKISTDILRECYARGEIDREEFLRRLEDLNGR